MESVRKHKRTHDAKTTKEKRKNEDVAALREEVQRLQLHNAELQYYHQYMQHALVYGSTQQQQQQQQMLGTSIVQCPNTLSYHDPNGKNIFLSGPIYNENWQRDVSEKLQGQTVCIYNPRRDDWRLYMNSSTLVDREKATEKGIVEQHSWELDHFEKSNCVAFWFPWEQHNVATTLLQLGRSSAVGKYMFVGIHSRNANKKIIYEFVKRCSANAYVTSSLEKLGVAVANWAATGRMPETNSQGSSSDETNSVKEGGLRLRP